MDCSSLYLLAEEKISWDMTGWIVKWGFGDWVGDLLVF